jgi:Ribbon-helix-helix protein, copG family
MRTTVTLDPDVAARLRRLARERGASFKSTINETLRAGLEAGRTPGRRYEEQTADLGVLPGIDITKAMALASELEDEAVARKIELRK